MEDNDSVSISSEFSTTEDSSTESPLVKRIGLGPKSDTQEANGTQNGLPHGLIQSPPKEELGAFVIQLDTAHWQHELQILIAMSTNKDLKVSASGTLNGKRIIRPLDSTTHLWLQSCTCISQKPVKFIQLIRKSVVTAVMQNVHLFISMEALLADQRINTAERILLYNSSTKDMEPTRSVKVKLNMKQYLPSCVSTLLGSFMFNLMLQNLFAAIGVNVLAMLLLHVLQRENDAACAVVLIVLSNALQKCKTQKLST